MGSVLGSSAADGSFFVSGAGGVTAATGFDTLGGKRKISTEDEIRTAATSQGSVREKNDATYFPCIPGDHACDLLSYWFWNYYSV